MPPLTLNPPIAPPAERPKDGVPPLENGDRLTAPEFRRRYEAMPPGVRAELINGVVFLDMASLVSHRRHSKPHVRMSAWIGVYESRTPGLEVGDNGTVRLLIDDEYQPDLFLFIPEAAGGQARVDEDDYVEGAPELVIEIANTSANLDLNDKLDVYRRCGVREYVVWRTRDGAIDYFRLTDGHFVNGPGPVHKSGVFPGLWLDAAAMLGGDPAGVLRTLDEGLTAEREAHASFVERLRGG